MLVYKRVEVASQDVAMKDESIKDEEVKEIITTEKSKDPPKISQSL
jgi:hypothetical protein